jgi:hypothetical protein
VARRAMPARDAIRRAIHHRDRWRRSWGRSSHTDHGHILAKPKEAQALGTKAPGSPWSPAPLSPKRGKSSELCRCRAPERSCFVAGRAPCLRRTIEAHSRALRNRSQGRTLRDQEAHHGEDIGRITAARGVAQLVRPGTQRATARRDGRSCAPIVHKRADTKGSARGPAGRA